MTTKMEYHNPVLLKETVDGLNIKPDGVYVDVTFGGGGHSREIMKHLGTKRKTCLVLIKIRCFGKCNKR